MFDFKYLCKFSISKVNCLTMVVTFDLVSPVFRLFSSQNIKHKLQRDDKSMPKSSCARACQTLRSQVPASGIRRMQMLNYACPPHASYACPPSTNLVCDVTGLSVSYVVSACPILRGRAARFSWQMEVTQACFLGLESTRALTAASRLEVQPRRGRGRGEGGVGGCGGGHARLPPRTLSAPPPIASPPPPLSSFL